jgi:hypothetical protein
LCGLTACRWTAAALVAALASAPAASQADGLLHGRLELQQSGEFSTAGGAASDTLGNLRLVWEPSWGSWKLQIHYLVSAEDGPDVAQGLEELALLHAPAATWLDLTNTFVRGGSLLAFQTLDRLNVAYTSPQWVVRLGRQAMTWGSGLVFRPMDLFDPFSPTATDTEYKPGADMLYVQHLFADGSDLQLIAAPRPEYDGGAPTGPASSEALHYRASLLGHAVTLLLAHDHGDWVGGAGVNGALGGATWNLELVPTFEPDHVRVSGVANLSDAVTFAGRNATVFAEYFHNGFGVTGPLPALTDLPPDLLDRLARGQVFTLRRNYLAAGMTLEVTPLFTASPTVITGLDDGSVFLLLAASCSLADDLVLAGGLQVPLGKRGSEYGGLPLTSADPTLLAPPRRIYVQLRKYF